jgi:hypothetical protein
METAKRQVSELTWRFVVAEPPDGIEPSTYALRVGRKHQNTYEQFDISPGQSRYPKVFQRHSGAFIAGLVSLVVSLL